MIILTKEALENNEQISNILEKEKQLICYTIESQESLKSTLLDYMQKLADSTDDVDTQFVDTILNILKDFKNSLELFKVNMELLKSLTDSLDNISLALANRESHLDVELVNTFNISFFESNETIIKNTLQIENILHSILPYFEFKFSDFNYIPVISEVSFKEINKEEKLDTTVKEKTKKEEKKESIEETKKENLEKISKENNKDENIENSIEEKEIQVINTLDILENTLLISETKGKIFLPYTSSLLNEILKNNPDKYSSIEDIIEKEYTLSFDLFKNLTIARFREAFKLIRKKEKGTIKEAFDLGMELIFNYNLHPAIISACKNLDELDIYLDYLEDNEIDKFDLFKIVFDIAPVVVKNKKS